MKYVSPMGTVKSKYVKLLYCFPTSASEDWLDLICICEWILKDERLALWQFCWLGPKPV